MLWIFGTVIKEYRLNAARERERAALFAADRDARAQEAVSLERARLARELHDTVGHALNVVVIQAGAAQRVFGKKPHMALEAIGAIESAGRQAMTDMERMLGILRSEARDADAFSAQPGLAQLDRLLEQVREAGLPVDLQVTWQTRRASFEHRPLLLPHHPGGVDEHAQARRPEGHGARRAVLLRHRARARGRRRRGAARACGGAAPRRCAHADSAQRVGRAPTGAATDVATPSDSAASADDPSAPALGSWTGGRGLVGMRERVALFGGVLEVGPRAEGGYRVFARLPLAPG